MKSIVFLTFLVAVGVLSVFGYSLSGKAQSEDIPTPTPQSSIVVQGENIAVLGKGSASVEGPSVNGAIDGDPKTMWNSKHFAPHWFSIDFDDFFLVNKIELVVSQHEPGPTTHEIWLGNDSRTTTLYKRFVDVQTEEGQTLDVVIDPPQRINKVHILTRQSQGWVAWYEVRIFRAIELGQWQLKQMVSGLELPVQITHAGDSSQRLFVVEQMGRIRIIRDGVVSETPFLDISNRVDCCGERGLLNVAFPPSYAASQQFYISYTNIDGDTVISRFGTSDHPDRADPDSEEILLTVEQPHENHNGGWMVFGPQDGYLYIGSGDGGHGIGTDNSGPPPSSLLGKLLRIDVETELTSYSIPTSNPFIKVDGYRDEIWALGLRNPWGFAFDSKTGDLYIPDTGASRREEVNYQSAESEGGDHYGWPIWEGHYCFEYADLSCGSIVDPVFPVSEFEHPSGCAIVGGAVYQSVFLFADLCRGHVWGLQRHGDGWKNTLLIDNSGLIISSIGTDESGNVFVASIYEGSIFILMPSLSQEENHAPIEEQMDKVIEEPHG